MKTKEEIIKKSEETEHKFRLKMYAWEYEFIKSHSREQIIEEFEGRIKQETAKAIFERLKTRIQKEIDETNSAKSDDEDIETLTRRDYYIVGMRNILDEVIDEEKKWCEK